MFLVFKCKYIVTWCIDKFVQNRRTISLQISSHVLLAPSVFKKMLKLPEPKLTYKGEEARNFLSTPTGLTAPLADLIPKKVKNKSKEDKIT